jgi:glutamate-1-semialdehyde 2,1-aminomutase
MSSEEQARRLAAARPRTAEWHARARAVLAGGTGHDLRAAAAGPTIVTHARGAHKWDVDGRRYIDYGLGGGALLLGHAHPAVAAAARAALDRGTHFGNDHPDQIRWAEVIQRLLPCAERVRFVNSGSEAAMLAARLARACTGRGRLVRFEGHFHGWHDDLVSGHAWPFDRPGTRGLAPGAPLGSLLLPANDLPRLEAALAAEPDVAAVILEPSGASWGTVPLAPGFLAAVRETTRRHGVLLIFDEVITGFRWAPGGAQARHGVVPDLATLGKIIAGGLPGAAVCGRADVMEGLAVRGDARRDRFERVLHFGTFNANPVSAAAGLACLEIVAGGEPQRRADALAAALRTGLDEVLKRRGAAGYAYGEASAFHVFLEALPGRGLPREALPTLDAGILKGIPGGLVGAVQDGLRVRGVELLSGLGGMTSAAHDERDVADTVAAFDDLVAELAGRVVALAP